MKQTEGTRGLFEILHVHSIAAPFPVSAFTGTQFLQIPSSIPSNGVVIRMLRKTPGFGSFKIGDSQRQKL